MFSSFQRRTLQLFQSLPFKFDFFKKEGWKFSFLLAAIILSWSIYSFRKVKNFAFLCAQAFSSCFWLTFYAAGKVCNCVLWYPLIESWVYILTRAVVTQSKKVEHFRKNAGIFEWTQLFPSLLKGFFFSLKIFVLLPNSLFE